jgi:hypothetical protein
MEPKTSWWQGSAFIGKLCAISYIGTDGNKYRDRDQRNRWWKVNGFGASYKSETPENSSFANVTVAVKTG